MANLPDAGVSLRRFGRLRSRCMPDAGMWLAGENQMRDREILGQDVQSDNSCSHDILGPRKQSGQRSLGRVLAHTTLPMAFLPLGSCALVLIRRLSWLERVDGARTTPFRPSSPGVSSDLPKEYCPLTNKRGFSNSQLRTLPDGKLSFLVTDRLVISVWVLSLEGCWARHAEADMEETCFPMLELQDAFLRIGDDHRTRLVETKTSREMFWFQKSSSPYEVDLASRLSLRKRGDRSSYV